jgi:uncharacterized membrane protein
MLCHKFDCGLNQLKLYFQVNLMNKGRITSIDLLRGLAMIIMALDHTRDYFHADAFVYDPTNLQKTTVLLFFTRWITHFCAPVFVLLAGTSAFISGQKKAKKELSLFLLKRGLWLVFLELTVVNFAWFFNIHFSYFGLQVIWALGVGMICLSGLIYLPKKAILFTGLVLVAGHNLLDNFHVSGNSLEAFGWGILHERRLFTFGNVNIRSAYPLLPWIGLMALGYCIGNIFIAGFNPAKRKRILIYLGSASVLLFIVIRFINIYGDLFPWAQQSSYIFSFLSFINVTKYPPSFDFLLITVGPALLFLAFTEKSSNRITKIISIYGRVPLFYYLIHIYVIHLLAMLAAVLTGYKWTYMTSFTHGIHFVPNLKGYGFSLGIVYLVWIAVVVSLYPICKWYDGYKTKHKEKWWLSYL